MGQRIAHGGINSALLAGIQIGGRVGIKGFQLVDETARGCIDHLSVVRRCHRVVHDQSPAQICAR